MCVLSLSPTQEINTHYNVHVEHTVFAHIHVHTYGYFLATCLYTVTPSPITLTHSHPHTSATFQFLLSRVNLLSALTLHLQDERSQLLVCHVRQITHTR